MVLEELLEKTVSIREAAEILKCTERTVHTYIEQGKLDSARKQRYVVLDRSQVEALADARQIVKQGVVAA